MADLTDSQLAFLRAQRIGMGDLFDATGMRKSDYQAAMREQGRSFAYGVTPCAAGGHSLRTRAGHCIQCDTAKIAYMLRHAAPANVYVAASASARLIKVGSTIDLDDRTDKLRRHRYGGAADWQMLATAHVASAGRVESGAHALLAPFSTPGHYERAGRRQACHELFRCGFADAEDAVCRSLPRGKMLTIPSPDRARTAFRFLEG